MLIVIGRGLSSLEMNRAPTRRGIAEARFMDASEDVPISEKTVSKPRQFPSGDL